MVEFMIEKGAEVNHGSIGSGVTALHMAVQHGLVKVVKSLIRAGALINATDKHLNTPLHLIKLMILEEWPYFSTLEDYYATCELLLAHGADVNAKDADGKTPFDVITNAKSECPL